MTTPTHAEAPAACAPGFAPTPTLSRHATDRDAARRGEPGLLERLSCDPATRLVLVDAGGRVALAAPAVSPDLPPDGLTPFEPAPQDLGLADLRATDVDLDGLTLLYLGCSEASGESWIAAVLPDAPGDRPQAGLARALRDYPLSALRAVGASLDAHDAGLATAAVALATWHARTRFCSACAGALVTVEAGWAARCTSCGTVFFPRTDPAVIMAVTDDADRLVLVHGASWEARRFSVVAGFVEAGESAESAVVREVAEETGLRVAAVEPVATQPWPFPRSLMLGYRARLAAGQNQPVTDGQEVTDTRVLSRAELAAAVADGSLLLPGSTSIARLLIEDWYGGPIACDTTGWWSGRASTPPPAH